MGQERAPPPLASVRGRPCFSSTCTGEVFGDKPQPVVDAIDDWPASCGLAAWQAIPHIQTLLAAARDSGIPIVHVTGREEDGLAGPRTRREIYGSSDRSPDALARRARRWDIIDEGCAPARRAGGEQGLGQRFLGHTLS